MKENFTSFYENQEDDYLKIIWESPNTRFVFDTNVLLSLYSFQKESREDFIKILKLLNPRLWIPHHVALEFQRNRLKVIKNHRIYIQEMQKETESFLNSISFNDTIFTTFKNSFSTKNKLPNIHSKVEDLISNITFQIDGVKEILKNEVENIKKLIADTDQEKIFLNSKDHIRDEFDNIFINNSLGENIYNTQELLDDLFKEGDKRYKSMTPPGYKDGITKEGETFSFNGLTYKSKFGDLIIFKQIISFAKDPNIKSIIFISEDVKEDWRIVENLNGKKILGARPELKQEIFKESSIENFYIFNINDFLNHTNNSFDLKISPSSVEDIKNSLSVNEVNNEVKSYPIDSSVIYDLNKEIEESIPKNTLLGFTFDATLHSSLDELNLKIKSLNDSKNANLEYINLPNFPIFYFNYEEIKENTLRINTLIEKIYNSLTVAEFTAFMNLLSKNIYIMNLLIELNGQQN